MLTESSAARRPAEAALFHTIFQHTSDAVLVIDPGRERIVDANPAACDKLRYPHATLLTQPPPALFPGCAERLYAFHETLLARGHGTLEQIDCRIRTGGVLPVAVDASLIDFDGRRCLLLLLRDLSRHRREERTLRTLVEGTAAQTGQAFFSALVRSLADALGVSSCFVSEFTQVRTRVRMLAFWNGDGYADNIEYSLAGTPCEAVLNGEIRHYPDHVEELFPEEHGVRGYLAIPLTDPGGKVLGHLAAFDGRPMPIEARELSVFRIFASRATAELLRQRAERRRQAAERALRASEERLSKLLASAMDAVIAFDERHHINLFNAAAEKVFRCSADWANGQPFDRFLSPQFRSLLERYLQTFDTDVRSRGQLWAPNGLTALRADGEEFPIEATISATQADSKRFYTVILRDVNERQQAEQTLRRLYLEKEYLREQIEDRHDFENIVGGTATMRAVLDKVRKVAVGETTVLLLGETGTGKELLAQAIHAHSPRKEKLLVKLNCAALPAELIESELFGHEKGAFTGASAQHKGRFELADGGTLFLDEVGELSAPAQAKLLRALQEQEFERVGGSRPIRVDVRLIAATNRNLEDMVATGLFRADLYYRLNVFPLRVPSLRERADDIPVLARFFLHNLGRKLGKPLTDLSTRAVMRLMNYPWPGNIRELQNIIERAAILSPGPLIEVDEALEMRLEAPGERQPVGTLTEVECGHIRQVLEITDWVIEGEQGAAALLGINPSTLRSRMKKFGIRKH